MLVQKDMEGRELVAALESDTKNIENSAGAMITLYKSIMSHRSTINEIH